MKIGMRSTMLVAAVVMLFAWQTEAQAKGNGFFSGFRSWMFKRQPVVADIKPLPPSVISTKPEDGADFVALNKPIEVKFDRAMDLSSLQAQGAVTLIEGVGDISAQVPIEIKRDDADHSLFRIDKVDGNVRVNFSPGMVHSVNIATAVKDERGSQMGKDMSFSFTTMPVYPCPEGSVQPTDPQWNSGPAVEACAHESGKKFYVRNDDMDGSISYAEKTILSTYTCLGSLYGLKQVGSGPAVFVKEKTGFVVPDGRTALKDNYYGTEIWCTAVPGIKWGVQFENDPVYVCCGVVKK